MTATVNDSLLNPTPAGQPVLSAALIRATCEEFQVREIPTYLPDGVGEHLFLWIEKRDTSSGELLQHLRQTLRITEKEIGIAGQKDRRAVTQQFVSVPRRCGDNLAAVSTDRVRVLSVSAHGNKLRTGHLRGNRFCVVLRPTGTDDFQPTDCQRVESSLRDLAQAGFPNYFGPQRFGHRCRSFTDGVIQLQSSRSPRRRNRNARFLVSAVQSAVFNLVLEERVRDGSFRTPLAGDVVCRRGGMRPFAFNDRGDTQAECLIPMGPMPGSKMMAATEQPATMEAAVLSRLELSPDMFQGKQTPGTRRAMVEFPSDVSATLSDGRIECRFTLSSGAYATVLLAQICQHIAVASGNTERSVGPL